MRLICGLVRLDGAPAQAETLKRMLDALTSPGLKPLTCSRTEGPAALGVLDFAGVSAVDGFRLGRDGTWLAADLRLDRWNEPSPELFALAALEQWGEDLPDRLDGDFALAGWSPIKQTLVIARDIMGVRPLCYAYLPGRLFAFASLPRGLHASGVIARRLDPIALGRVLVETYSRDGLTGFVDITWVPAGHTVTLSPRGVRVHNAWRPDPATVGKWRGSAAESAAAIKTLVEQAVASRLGGSGPVAAHLSGGLDSSALAVIAARQLRGQGRRLFTYSMLARAGAEPILDEREYVQAVLRQEADMEWSAVYQPARDEEGVLDDDLPLSGPMAQPDTQICSAAAASGNQVLISGAGGDEGATYNGLGIPLAMLREGSWRSLYTELRARARRSGQSFLHVAAGQLLGPLLPRRSAGGRSDKRLEHALSFLRPALKDRVRSSFTSQTEFGSSPRDRAQLMAGSYLADRANRWSTLAARHGLAFTYPLADRKLLDFSLSLPAARLVDGSFSRQPFRNGMAGILPEEIRWRTTKFVPFPDAPLNIATSAPGLLAQLRTVRRCDAAADMFDMDAIAVALTAAANCPVAQSQTLRPNGQPSIPPAIKMAIHAERALTLAKYVARLA